MKRFCVGGAIRDKHLGIAPKDFDWVLVGATESDIEELLHRGFKQVGADFPVFLHPETGEEYALARIERKVGIGYHGFEVQTAGVTIEEDLARRDLTINSMAEDEDGNLIDPYGGIADLHNGILRHTTEAFAEDPLRVLRLARFAARGKWRIAPETIELCKRMVAGGELKSLTIERVWLEINKAFCADFPAHFVQVLSEVGALDDTPVLRDIFSPDRHRAAAMIAAASTVVPTEVRALVAVAVIAAEKNALPGASSRQTTMQKSAAALKQQKLTAADVHRLLRNTRALQDKNALSDLIWSAVVLETLGFMDFTGHHLYLAIQAAQRIKAADFDIPPGKELGEKIRMAQEAAIADMLNIPEQ